jgi:hypothetical protein
MDIPIAWKPPPFLTLLPLRLDDFRKEAACCRAMNASSPPSSSAPSSAAFRKPSKSKSPDSGAAFCCSSPEASLPSKRAPAMSTSASDRAGDGARCRCLGAIIVRAPFLAGRTSIARAGIDCKAKFGRLIDRMNGERSPESPWRFFDILYFLAGTVLIDKIRTTHA